VADLDVDGPLRASVVGERLPGIAEVMREENWRR